MMAEFLFTRAKSPGLDANADAINGLLTLSHS